MSIRFRTADEPPKARLDYWQHVMASALAPYAIRAESGSIRSEVGLAQIGPVTAVAIRCSAMEFSRTTELIRDSDLGLCKIDLGAGGQGVYEQDGRESVLRPGEFHLIELRRPSHVAVERSHEGAAVIFPRTLLPVRDTDIRNLTAVRFSPREPYAALVSSLVREMQRHLDAYGSARDTRIGTAFLDLLALAVTARVDRVSAVPAESRQRAMLLRIRAFIEHHLGDSALSPAMIAAAHHISVRTLHKLHETENDTVAASIRRRRLERCRQDLLDPGLSHRPVGAVGARWGFPDATAFSRAFRAAYGLPPAEYRATHGKAGTEIVMT
jgi:AraC-like DNA-binding protein